MKGLAAAVKGMKLVDTKKSQDRGRRAFHLGVLFNANPCKSDTERRNWEIGYKDASAKWDVLLKRNGGALGMRPSLASPNPF